MPYSSHTVAIVLPTDTYMSAVLLIGLLIADQEGHSGLFRMIISR